MKQIAKPIEIVNVPNCLFHRVRQPIRKFLVEDTETKKRVHYGLCRECNREFNKSADFKQKINDQLIIRLKPKEGKDESI